MAITPDVTTVTVDDVIIGLSDTIANLIASGDFTIDNLTPYMFCGQSTVGNVKYNSLSGADRSYNGRGESLPGYFPVYNTGSQGDVTVEYANREAPSLSHDSYGRNILIHGSLGIGGEPQSIRSDNMTASDMRVVTSINFKKIYYDVEMAAQTVTYNPPSGTGTYYTTGAMGRVKTVDNDADTGCFVYSLFGDSTDWYCVKDWMFPASDYANNLWQFCSFQTMTGNYGNMGASILYGFSNYANDKAMSRAVTSTNGDVYGEGSFTWNISGSPAVVDGDLISVCSYEPYSGTCRFYLSGLDNALNQVANAGLKFYWNNTWYKPTSSGGVITGYTDDMTEQSEWDEITNVTGNVVPVTPVPPVPPVPGDDDDNKDPVSTAGAPFASGLCHYYALTAGSVLLEHISEALGTWDIENTHKDLYRNLISCKLIKPPAPIPTTGSAPFTIYGVKPQYGGADITLPVVSGNPDNTFGPYTIDRKFGDFRDYAPYTRVSIFLPYCGWCDLPSHVVGRQVSVRYYTDIIAATCKAVVFCGNNIVAESAGVIGLDIPFAADNVGAKMQAVTAGMIAALGGGIQLGAGIGSMVSTKSGNGGKAALSGASQYLSGYSQMAMAFNENSTEISGKNGDGCCLSGATNIIIKIIRPKKGSYTTAPYTPPGYGHNIGYVSQKQVRVSTVSGLLIADNVDTSGIAGATEAERAEIKRVLETGLIVNAAPE